MEQSAQQHRKYRAKEALETLCRISDTRGEGVVSYVDFRVFLNKVQVHLPDDVMSQLKSHFSASSNSLQYPAAIQALDWSPLTSQWQLLVPSPLPSPISIHKPHPAGRLQAV